MKIKLMIASAFLLFGGVGRKPMTTQAFVTYGEIAGGSGGVITQTPLLIANPVCTATASGEHGGILLASVQIIGDQITVSITSDPPPAFAPQDITVSAGVVCMTATQ